MGRYRSKTKSEKFWGNVGFFSGVLLIFGGIILGLYIGLYWGLYVPVISVCEHYDAGTLSAIIVGKAAVMFLIKEGLAWVAVVACWLVGRLLMEFNK